MLQTTMRFISALITIYTLAIFVRILLTWFGNRGYSPALKYLMMATDPYLNWFRRFTFLRTERFDFSPLFGIMVLSVAGNITNTIATYGTITLGIVLAIMLSALWSAVSFFLMLFIILIVIRLFGTFSQINTVGTFWLTVDNIVSPLTLRMSNWITGGRQVTYRTGLILTGSFFLVVWALGRWGIPKVLTYLQTLPM